MVIANFIGLFLSLAGMSLSSSALPGDDTCIFHRFKTVGPFVVMIYRMITGDLLRFVIIYLVFVMGFSQAFFIIFRSYKKPKTPNPLGSPAESVIAMFMMSLSSFDSTFDSFQYTDHEGMAWVFFVIYMAIVTILLINMLIAMMGNTYTKIAETRNEWQRQVGFLLLKLQSNLFRFLLFDFKFYDIH